MANKKDFKGVADSYFSKTTPITPKTPIAQKASITPETQTTPIASITQIAPIAQSTPKNAKRLNLYIQGSLIADIKKIAAIEGKKVNSLICEVLKEYAKTKTKAIDMYNQYHNQPPTPPTVE